MGTGREGRRTKVLGRDKSSWFEKQQRYGGEEIVLPPEVEEKAGPSCSTLNPAHQHIGKSLEEITRKKRPF